MKTLYKYFTASILCIASCRGQDKDVNNVEKPKAEIYLAKCQNERSNNESLFFQEKNWSLTKKDIGEILKLSSEISENEWHFSYPVLPCNIELKSYPYQGRNYDIHING